MRKGQRGQARGDPSKGNYSIFVTWHIFVNRHILIGEKKRNFMLGKLFCLSYLMIESRNHIHAMPRAMYTKQYANLTKVGAFVSYLLVACTTIEQFPGLVYNCLTFYSIAPIG